MVKNNISSEELDAFLGPAKTDGLLALNEISLSKDAVILDVGTGVGVSAIFLALNGFKVITGEPETDNSVYAKMDWESNAKRFGVIESINFQAFNATQMPFQNNSFDAVVFFGSLHHIDEKMRKYSIEEGLRVCKERGSILFFEPTAETILKIRHKFPKHPLAANPKNYLNTGIDIKHIQGEMMDVYIAKT